MTNFAVDDLKVLTFGSFECTLKSGISGYIRNGVVRKKVYGICVQTPATATWPAIRAHQSSPRGSPLIISIPLVDAVLFKTFHAKLHSLSNVFGGVFQQVIHSRSSLRAYIVFSMSLGHISVVHKSRSSASSFLLEW